MTFLIQLAKLKKPWDDLRPSIYEFIQTHFSCENPSGQIDEARLPDWELDSSFFGKRKVKPQPLVELVEKFVFSPDAKTFSVMYESFLYFDSSRLDNLIKLLESYLMMQNEDFRQLLIWLIKNSPDSFVVSLCLKILSRYKNAGDRKLFFALASHNYFREIAMNYVIHSNYEVEDGLWHLAKYPYGCSRTHIVPNLPENPKQEIKDWLLREAPNGELLVEYAMDCVQKGDLKGALSKEIIDDSLLTGATRLTDFLTTGVVGGNLNNYEHGPEATFLLIKHLYKAKRNSELLDSVSEIQVFVEKMLKSEKTRQRWLEASKEILPFCTAILEYSIIETSPT